MQVLPNEIDLFHIFLMVFHVMETCRMLFWFMKKIFRCCSSKEISLDKCTQTEVLTWHPHADTGLPQKPVPKLSYLTVVLLCRTPSCWSGCGFVSNSFSSRNLCSYIWGGMFLQNQSTKCFDLSWSELENISRINVNICLTWLTSFSTHTL